MRQLVGGRAIKDGAASASAMGRFETEMLTRPENLRALIELPGRWIDAVHDKRPPKVITLDMDSSESPVHGDQCRTGSIQECRDAGEVSTAPPEHLWSRSWCVAHCCGAWNELINQPWRIRSIGRREWAHGF